jgi:hypothetical protein
MCQGGLYILDATGLVTATFIETCRSLGIEKEISGVEDKGYVEFAKYRSKYIMSDHCGIKGIYSGVTLYYTHLSEALKEEKEIKESVEKWIKAIVNPAPINATEMIEFLGKTKDRIRELKVNKSSEADFYLLLKDVGEKIDRLRNAL